MSTSIPWQVCLCRPTTGSAIQGLVVAPATGVVGDFTIIVAGDFNKSRLRMLWHPVKSWCGKEVDEVIVLQEMSCPRCVLLDHVRVRVFLVVFVCGCFSNSGTPKVT